MNRIEGKIYTRTDVALDDAIFVGCRFKDCGLIYSGGDVAWEGCTFEHCRLECRDKIAFRTRQLLAAFGLALPVNSEIPSDIRDGFAS